MTLRLLLGRPLGFRIMPVPRVRLRTLIIAVAVIAVLFAAGREGMRLYRISKLHRQRASGYAQLEAREQSVRARFEAKLAKLRLDANSYRNQRIPDGTSDTESKLLSVMLLSYRDNHERAFAEMAEFTERSARLWQEAITEHKVMAEDYARLKRWHEQAVWRPWRKLNPSPAGRTGDWGGLKRAFIPKPGWKAALDLWTAWRVRSKSARSQ